MATKYISQLHHTQTLQHNQDVFVFIRLDAQTGSIAPRMALSRVMTEEELRALYKSKNLSDGEIEAEILKVKKVS